MIEIIFMLIAFIVTLPVRIACLIWILLTFPIWIWLEDTRSVYGPLLWKLFYDLDLRKDEDDE